MRKIAIVTSFLEETTGSGRHTLNLAKILSRKFEVLVLTTCSGKPPDWNYYPPGRENVEGIEVIRFPVDFDPSCFQELTKSLADIVYNYPHGIEEEILYIKYFNSPYSSSLLRFIRNFRDRYLFIFRYFGDAVNFFGLLEKPEKSILIFETPPRGEVIQVKAYEKAFPMPSGIVFLTPEEREFVMNRFGDKINKPVKTIGICVEPPVKKGEDSKQIHVEGRYILYIGSVDALKGVGSLLEYFKISNPKGIKLVLMGKGEVEEEEKILNLGEIEDQEIKHEIISSSELLVMPSLSESFSMVTMEAWLCEKPVLVNGNNPVLKGHVERSGGGLYYTNYEEFKESLERLLGDRELRVEMGEKGRKYVEENYSWESVEQKYMDIIDRVLKA